MKINSQPGNPKLTYDDVYCQVITALQEDFFRLVPLLSSKYGMDVLQLVPAIAAAAIHSGIYLQMAFVGLEDDDTTRVVARVSEVIGKAIDEHNGTAEQKQ